MNTIETMLSSDCVLTKQRFANKKGLIESVCQTLSDHEPTLNPRNLFKLFIERERLGATTLGHGVALPHIRTANISYPIACFIRLETPILFNETSNEACDLILALVVPEDSEQDHLNILAHFANCFHNEKFREQLRVASDKEFIIKLLAKDAKELQPAA